MKRLENRIILSGGGTGGHIFPAIAIAQELQALIPEVELLFVGAKGKMEMDKVPKAGYDILGLPVTAFHRRITWQNLLFPFKLLKSLYKAHQVIRSFQPSLVIGTGGFASGPLLRAASRLGVPTLIQEQNAFPGVTNRLLARRAERICVAHKGMEQWFPPQKISLTGNPVRKDLKNMDAQRDHALDYFHLEQTSPILLLFGGSLGAQALNEAVFENLEQISSLGIQMIWQTGPRFYPTALEKLEARNYKNIQVHAFLEQMNLAYAAADIVVCRSGAITLSELCLAAKPCILVPYPAAAGDHQMKNARSFEQEGAAWVLENHRVKNELVGELKRLIDSGAEQEKMRVNLARMAHPDAGQTIARLALELAQKNSV